MTTQNTQTPESSTKRRFVTALSLIAVGALGATGLSYGLGQRTTDGSQPTQTVRAIEAEQANATETAAPATDSLLFGNASIADTVENHIARDQIDSIVGITVKVSQSGQTMTPFGMQSGMPRYIEGVGSGVILTQEGLIITNSHVVNGGKNAELTVTLADDSTYDGEVLWADDTLDLALVQIDAPDLKPITIAQGDALEVGDRVIAIGNPLGLDLQSTLTSGVVSGLERSITVSGGNTMENLIQTDAAINSGNSGGALLNSAGELVAINTAKASQADGIGFAIPIETALPIIERVLETGSYEQVALGITGMKADDYEAMIYQTEGKDLELPSGVYVASVADGSAADTAGIQEGDVIVKLNDTPTPAMNALKKALIPFRVGDAVTLEISRDGETLDTTVTFAQTLSELSQSAPETPIDPVNPDDEDPEGSEDSGLTDEELRDMMERFMQEFNRR